MHKITIGGHEVHAVVDSKPNEVNDVKVYSSNSWHTSQPGSFLVIETRAY